MEWLGMCVGRITRVKVDLEPTAQTTSLYKNENWGPQEPVRPPSTAAARRLYQALATASAIVYQATGVSSSGLLPNR